MRYPTFATIILTLLVSACTSHTPSYIVLNPQVPDISQHQTNSIPITLKTIDTRKANFVLRYDENNDASRLVSPAESPREQLENLFKKSFNQAGFEIIPNSAQPNTKRHIEIQLEKLITTVNEDLFNYQANTDIIINIIVTNGNKTLTKRYNAKGKRKGFMSADFASLELEINQLLTQLSFDVIQDPELNQFLTQDKNSQAKLVNN